MERFAGFDWDAGNEAKCLKHGVSRREIEEALSEPLAVLHDEIHSQSEARHQAVGVTSSGRYIFAVYTVRERQGERLVRPISARYMHRKEVRRYEHGNED